ncbi:Flagellar biosynthetic protein FliP, partial [Clarias magur]
MWPDTHHCNPLRGQFLHMFSHFGISNDSQSTYLSLLAQTQVGSSRLPFPLPHYIIVSKATITVLTHKPLRQSDYLGIMPMISSTQVLSQVFAEGSKAQSKTLCSDMPRNLAAIFVRMAKLPQ